MTWYFLIWNRYFFIYFIVDLPPPPTPTDCLNPTGNDAVGEHRGPAAACSSPRQRGVFMIWGVGGRTSGAQEFDTYLCETQRSMCDAAFQHL